MEGIPSALELGLETPILKPELPSTKQKTPFLF
jgi:hypothetical protein